MSADRAEYYGAALSSFVLAFGETHSLVQKILADAGVTHIDPTAWYDYEWASAIFYRIEQQIGSAAITAVGRKMIEAAVFPSGIDSVEAVLMSLGAAFKLNTRGPDIGDILCILEDPHNATIVRTQRGSCAFNIGIIEGACARHGARATVEHAAGGCQDRGAKTCIYHVSW